MSNTLPKEQQTAYQRWEMASFGDDRPSQVKHDPAIAIAAVAASIAEQEERIAHAREEGRAQGHAAGFAEGRSAGIDQGRAQVAHEKLLLQQIAEAFGSEVAQANEIIAQDLLDLALDLSKAMLKTALAARPELLLPVVSEAIGYLPTLQQPALLFLNPDDALLVRQQMGDELVKSGWRITEDLHMERGGCRIETASNQIDASTSTRWQRLAASLGRELDWLA